MTGQQELSKYGTDDNDSNVSDILAMPLQLSNCFVLVHNIFHHIKINSCHDDTGGNDGNNDNDDDSVIKVIKMKEAEAVSL